MKFSLSNMEIKDWLTPDKFNVNVLDWTFDVSFTSDKSNKWLLAVYTSDPYVISRAKSVRYNLVEKSTVTM